MRRNSAASGITKLPRRCSVYYKGDKEGPLSDGTISRSIIHIYIYIYRSSMSQLSLREMEFMNSFEVPYTLTSDVTQPTNGKKIVKLEHKVSTITTD